MTDKVSSIKVDKMNDYSISEIDFNTIMSKALKIRTKELKEKYRGKSTDKTLMAEKNCHHR
jgi:hypothetical protein